MPRITLASFALSSLFRRRILHLSSSGSSSHDYHRDYCY
jgi:hypothetical protein